MTQTYSRLRAAALSVMPFLLLTPMAHAQIGNQPFSFGNSRGTGISVGGREAILNEKLLGTRPDNLLRTPNGELLDIQKGPGGSAFASYPGTNQYLPQYRGIGFNESHPEMAAGVFNGYFLPVTTASYNYPQSSPSGATVNTWTARVTSGGMPISYQEGNVVDSWTGQVLVLNMY